MQFSKLFDDDRAVSPVIGVILMVAITVILAAVIGTFVLGLGDQVQQTTPQASFGFDTADAKTEVTITHESGDAISSSDLSVSTSKTFNSTTNPSTTGTSLTWNEMGVSDDVTAGTSVTIGPDAAATDFAGDTIRVIYNNPNSDKSATLGKFEVPN